MKKQEKAAGDQDPGRHDSAAAVLFIITGRSRPARRILNNSEHGNQSGQSAFLFCQLEMSLFSYWHACNPQSLNFE